MKVFITTMESLESRIDYTIVSDSEVSVKLKRTFSSCVIQALEYCCRQGIALTGLRDDGIMFEKEQSNTYKLNFNNLLILISEISKDFE